MEKVKQTVEMFFAKYADRFNRSLGENPVVDVDGVMGSFAECFVEASPVGFSCGKNDDQFREQIPKGFEFYKSIGTQSMKIASLEITPLDDLHWAVKVHWESRYKKQDGSDEQIDFDVIYLLQILDETPKIFAYITGDEQKLLRDRGLVPG